MSKGKNSAFMLGILAALSLAHGLNDAMQSIISAIYPLLKVNLSLSGFFSYTAVSCSKLSKSRKKLPILPAPKTNIRMVFCLNL